MIPIRVLSEGFCFVILMGSHTYMICIGLMLLKVM
jgi:hypothetical protein